jgi:hypothetical protein
MLTAVLGEECDLGVIKSIHTQVEELITAHKESRDPEPLSINKPMAKTILRGCGIDEQKVEKFGEAMDENFGMNAEIPPKNIISPNKFELKTPEVSIKVSPDSKDLVTTEKRGEEKYILIKIKGNVELNGILMNSEE